MFEELVIRCRDNGMKLCGHMQTDFWDAADAIEKLEAYCDIYKECGEKLMEAMRRIKEGST